MNDANGRSSAYQHIVSGRLARIFGGTVAAGGLVVVAAWLARLEPVLVPLSDDEPLVFHSALAFVLLGTALALSPNARRSKPALWAVIACTSLVSLLSLLVVAEYGFFLGLPQRDLWVDGLLVTDHLSTSNPGRMAGSSAVAFLLASAALVLGVTGERRGTGCELCAGGVLAIAVVTAVSYLLGVGAETEMPIQACLLFLVLGTGLLLAPPVGWFACLLFDHGPGGSTTRRLLPVALLLPGVLGWLRLQAQKYGLIQLHQGIELMVLVLSTAMFAVVVRMASRLRQDEAKLRELNAQLELFVGTASHELRTPLVAVRNFTDTMLKRWDDIPDTDLRTYVGIIDEQSRRLLRIVSDLLTVSRIRAGKVGGVPTDVDVSEILQAVVAELSASDVALEIDGEPRIHVDRDHLKQMLINYLSNAIKYGKPPIVVAARRAGDKVCIGVCDRGEGVPPDQADAVFAPFAQSDGNGRDGTGLGLSIVRGLAREYGGDAWYEPNEPDGARFMLALPAASASAVAQ